MYITGKQLKKIYRNSIIRHRGQVLLVKEALRSRSKIQGIASNILDTKGVQMIEVNESKAFPFIIVEKLPRDLDCMLG